jgi:hypothetical protein
MSGDLPNTFRAAQANAHACEMFVREVKVKHNVVSQVTQHERISIFHDF